jgi:PAS domain S-box-containing protein
MNAETRSEDRLSKLSDGDEAPTLRQSPHVAGSGTDAEHLRLLFDNMLEGYAYCRIILDDTGQPDDFVYVDVNRAFSRLTGLADVVGKRVTEVIPDIKDSNPEVLETYGRVARTGEPEQFEVDLEQLGIVLNISVFRPEPDHFVAVFEDITERRRAEKRLEDLVRFLEIRVEQRTNDLAEALRILNRPARGDTSSET